MIKNDLESALELWDALDDKAEIFVPVMQSEVSKKNLFFIERDGKNKGVLLLRVFIDKEEGEAYKTNKKVSKIFLAETTLGHLLISLEKNLKIDVDKRIDCVLSTLDMEGNFRSIETLWSNTNKNS